MSRAHSKGPRQQVERVGSGPGARDVRGPRFQPLRRALKVPVWGDLSIRLGLALGLIMLLSAKFHISESITGLIGAVLIGISLLWSMRYNRKHGTERETA